MPNRNYLRGVRFERERLKHYKEVMKHEVMRTAGSHGKFDIITVDAPRAIVTLIQCKVVSSLSQAESLIQKFRESPPLVPMANIHQCMEVKVTGSKEVHSATV